MLDFEENNADQFISDKSFKEIIVTEIKSILL
jgi:hypothetical protein